MSDQVLQFIAARRSVRSYTGEPVPRPDLEVALRAAMAAPSARNSQPWRFLVITEPARIQAVCRAHPYAKFGENAGAVILPFGKKSGYQWFDQDMAAATENLLLALANLGLGATWCGMSAERQADVRSIIPLPDDLFYFALIPVGVPAEIVEPRSQYDESRVYRESYELDG